MSKQTIDELLTRYALFTHRFEEGYPSDPSFGPSELKQALCDLLLELPELQEKGGIAKGSKEHISGEVCLECGYGYISELGGCICTTDDELRYRVSQAIRTALLGEGQ